MPLLCPHGHVDASVLKSNEPFRDPTSLLISSDHYVTRLLHSNGISLDVLGVGVSLDEEGARRAWRIFCDNWSIFRGTPVRYWFQAILEEVFGIEQQPSTASADDIYESIAAMLRRDEFRPRSLFSRFNIEVLATTNDPLERLDDHQALSADGSFRGRVIPTFRPDRYLSVEQPTWNGAVDELGSRYDKDVDTYKGLLTALEQSREYFQANGATCTDHSHRDVEMIKLEISTAESLYASARSHTATGGERQLLRRALLFEMARMSREDGLVMCLHPAIYRNHHTPTLAAYGPDTGHDIPISVEFTRALQTTLNEFGTHPNFQLVLFTTDETAYSREIAPLAGFYPSVYVGAPWWFLDAPDAMLRARRSVSETAGFCKLAGFVDDTRAYCSIPARHDMSRRVDCTHLAGLVSDGRLDLIDAEEISRDLSNANPRKAFKLGASPV
jgi:glucuronate isomerase